MRKERLMRLMSAWIALVFLGFVLGNTAFVHTHTDGTHTYSHSHPWLPSAHHSHSAAAAEAFASLNESAGQITEAIAPLTIAHTMQTVVVIATAAPEHSSDAHIALRAGRAPPII